MLYREYNKMLQALRARGRAAPSTAEITTAMSPVRELASAEEVGRARESLHRMAGEERKMRGSEFADRLGLGRARLGLTRERQDIEKELGQERYRQAERGYKFGRKMDPWELGVGIGQVLVGGYQGLQQRKREQELLDALGELSKIDTRGDISQPGHRWAG